MRILLVNPWIYDFSAYDLWSKPLGLLYIASILRKLDCEVYLIDCLDPYHPGLRNLYTPKSNLWGCGKYYPQVVDKPVVLSPYPRRYKQLGLPKQIFCQEEVITSNKKNTLDLILVTSGMTYWYPGVTETINILKQKFPKILIILGGTYATLCTEHAKKYTKADFVFSGGEIKNLLLLIEKLTGKKFPLGKTPNNFLEFPPPDYSFYSHLEYIVLRTSVGCPFHCSYCAVNRLSPFLQKKPEKIVSETISLYEKYQVNPAPFFRNSYDKIGKEICTTDNELRSSVHGQGQLKERCGVKNFVFYDDALLINSKGHLNRILALIKEAKIKFFFIPLTVFTHGLLLKKLLNFFTRQILSSHA